MTIYILDDEALEREIWVFNISNAHPDWNVVAFSDVDSFKETASVLPPTMAVVDFVMPYESGLDVCKWLKSIHPQVKIAFNTGLDGLQFKILSESCGALYLSKSRSFQDRLKEIENAL